MARRSLQTHHNKETRGRKPTLNHAQIRRLYLQGKSIYWIGRKLDYKPKSVLIYLRKHHLVRPSIGRMVEQRVGRWLKRRGNTIQSQRGDAPFDLLVNGERVDVKSCHVSDKEHPSYFFQLYDRTNRKGPKNLHDCVDWFYLVFLDRQHSPIYRLHSSFVRENQVTLHLQKSLHTKYPIEFVGYLGKRDATGGQAATTRAAL